MPPGINQPDKHCFSRIRNYLFENQFPKFFRDFFDSPVINDQIAAISKRNYSIFAVKHSFVHQLPYPVLQITVRNNPFILPDKELTSY